MQLSIDLLKYQDLLRIKQEAGKKKVFDPIRKKYLILQPEEAVRQLLVLYLIKEKQYPKSLIQVEKTVYVNGLQKRYDIIIYNQQVEPFLLVECKAPHVTVNQAVFNQIARYNLSLQVQYLVVTNGLDTYCCKMNYEEQSYQFLSFFPSFSDLK